MEHLQEMLAARAIHGLEWTEASYGDYELDRDDYVEHGYGCKCVALKV